MDAAQCEKAMSLRVSLSWNCTEFPSRVFDQITSDVSYNGVDLPFQSGSIESSLIALHTSRASPSKRICSWLRQEACCTASRAARASATKGLEVKCMDVQRWRVVPWSFLPVTAAIGKPVLAAASKFSLSPPGFIKVTRIPNSFSMR